MGRRLNSFPAVRAERSRPRNVLDAAAGAGIMAAAGAAPAGRQRKRGTRRGVAIGVGPTSPCKHVTRWVWSTRRAYPSRARAANVSSRVLAMGGACFAAQMPRRRNLPAISRSRLEAPGAVYEPRPSVRGYLRWAARVSLRRCRGAGTYPRSYDRGSKRRAPFTSRDRQFAGTCDGRRVSLRRWRGAGTYPRSYDRGSKRRAPFTSRDRQFAGTHDGLRAFRCADGAAPEPTRDLTIAARSAGRRLRAANVSSRVLTMGGASPPRPPPPPPFAPGPGPRRGSSPRPPVGRRRCGRGSGRSAGPAQGPSR